MFLRKLGIAAGLCMSPILFAGSALALPQPWQMTFQPAASPVMERIESFHFIVLVIIAVICLFVFGLLAWIVVFYNQRSNPVPGKVTHNTLLEVAWTLIPVLILVFIAIPSFKLLYFEAEVPPADLTIKAIGHQWFWSYQYPSSNFQFDSLGLSDAAALKKGEPRLLGVDNVIVVPVNKVVKVVTTGADVIHSWAVPQFGVKMDAVPGRLNVTWFKATVEGTYYGQCSELCGARHAYMPIEVKVVSQDAYDAWLQTAKKKFASISGPDDGARVASASK
ncbi:MAG TPA: cytochrome c oxidase subunit II [Rhizomicrobium sp.]|jgi:cytochrome c oxidase subunit 2